MRTRLVVKLVVVLVLLLTVVLYQMNDFSKREKLSQAEKQVRNQIVSAKTSDPVKSRPFEKFFLVMKLILKRIKSIGCS